MTSDPRRTQVEDACADLILAGQPITFDAVAARAGWRASHFPDCGTNRFRSGKDLSLWPRSTESIPLSFVNRRPG